MRLSMDIKHMAKSKFPNAERDRNFNLGVVLLPRRDRSRAVQIARLRELPIRVQLPAMQVTSYNKWLERAGVEVAKSRRDAVDKF